MEENTANLNLHDKKRELAARLYDLDTEVYECLGSSISRSFTGDRELTIEILADLMGQEKKMPILRSELAMVSNMARTIRDKKVRSRIMREYDKVLDEIQALPDAFGTVDILDESRAKLNRAYLANRFKKEDNLIVCIDHTTGCAGPDIGFNLADALKIKYYDSEIFETVLERLEAAKDGVKDYRDAEVLGTDRKHRSLKEIIEDFQRYHGLPREDAIFFNQSDLLANMAKEESFVIMGRCADVILTNNRIPHINIFIDAPMEQRIHRIMELRDIPRKDAIKYIRKMDRIRRHYYSFYTGRHWGSKSNHDLCLNSASYGIDGSVGLICRMLDRHLPGYVHRVSVEETK